MAITASDVLYPAGRVHPDLLPEATDLSADITAWIDEAYGLARVDALETQEAKDAAAKKWAEYRAFDAACISLHANPAAADHRDQGNSRYDKDQRETICRMAAEALAEFEGLAPDPATEVQLVDASTRVIRNTFVW